MGGGYDEGYKACRCFWGANPGSLFQALEGYISDFRGLRVLDVGCGEGKNSIFLARKGASVWAADSSFQGIMNAVGFWPDSDLVTWLVADARALPLTSIEFDLVILYGLFHCLGSKEEIHSLAEQLKNATRRGGYHVVCAMNDRHQELHAHPGFTPCLVGHATYLELYSDWEVLYHLDSDLTETHPHNGIVHTHSMTRLLVRN